MEAPHTRLLRLEAPKYTPFLLEVEVDLRAVVEDFEDHPLGDAGAIAAKSVIHVSFGHQRGELLEDGLLWRYGGTAGTETLLHLGKLRCISE
jgi:hypothetical protein